MFRLGDKLAAIVGCQQHNALGHVSEMLFDLLKTDFIPSMQLSDADNMSPCEALKKARKRSKRNEQEISEIPGRSGNRVLNNLQ